MTRTVQNLGLAVLLAAAALPTLAQTTPAPAPAPEPDYTFTGNAGLFSDYRFRGISQTDRKPAFQGGFDFSHKSGFYLGNWNSNIDSSYFSGANLEMDFYGGYKGAVGDFSYDVGALYYYYNGSGNQAQYPGSFKIDNTELYVSGGWGPFSLKYSHAISDFFGAPDSKNSYYVDGSVSYPLPQVAGLTLVGHVGYQSLKGGAKQTEIGGSVVDTVTDWKLGAVYDLSGWQLGASYIGTNRDLYNSLNPGRNLSSDTLVVSVGKSF